MHSSLSLTLCLSQFLYYCFFLSLSHSISLTYQEASNVCADVLSWLLCQLALAAFALSLTVLLFFWLPHCLFWGHMQLHIIVFVLSASLHLSVSLCMLFTSQFLPTRHGAGKQRKESGSSPSPTSSPHEYYDLALLSAFKPQTCPTLPRGLCNDTTNIMVSVHRVSKAWPQKSKLAASFPANCKHQFA